MGKLFVAVTLSLPALLAPQVGGGHTDRASLALRHACLPAECGAVDHADNLQAAPADITPAQPLSPRVDPRTELLAIVFRLAGNPEYAMVRVPAYNEVLDTHFQPHRNHPVVQMARRLRTFHGVSYDAVMSMAIHLEDLETLALLSPLDAPGITLDQRWPRGDIAEFLHLLRDFVRVADVEGFLAAQTPLYAEVERQMQNTLDTHADVTWFERFYGESPGGGQVILSLAAGGGNYGPRFVAPDGEETVYAILGVWLTDQAGSPRIDRRVVPTLVHEFSHSFINHNVYAHLTEVADAGQTIYSLVEEKMKAQAYGTWMTMLCEMLVRAATARYVLEDEGEDAARRVVLVEQARGFLAMDELFDLLDEYEADRVRYPSLSSFMPRFVEWLNDLAPRAEAVRDVFEASRPRVVSTDPPHGATDVDATTTSTIVVRFDRPMARGIHLTLPPGEESHHRVSGEDWSDDATTLTLHVHLEPGKDHVLVFNTPLGGAFRSADGVAAVEYTLRFSSRLPTNPGG